MRRSFLLAALTATIMATVTAVPAPAAAAEDEAFARVVVDAAELRSGPGVSYRVIYTAHRGETLAVEERRATGFWLRVTLPDGRTAYVLGDEVQSYLVDPDSPDAPSRPGFFAPPPLSGSHGGLAIVGGVLRTPLTNGPTEIFGYMEIRPSVVVHPTLSLDAFVGAGLTSDGAQVLYGGGATVYFAPNWALCPFFSLGGGGLSVIPNSDTFVLKRQDVFAGRAGGGLLFALRNRILVRLEASNLTLFTADSFRNAQTFAGGLGVYF
ncbi:MAG: SH3 domain-containing protein [Polyangiaceae bacterium]|nr:SH3 domain-containing protein [Polyangiaceae bacterium]